MRVHVEPPQRKHGARNSLAPSSIRQTHACVCPLIVAVRHAWATSSVKAPVPCDGKSAGVVVQKHLAEFGGFGKSAEAYTLCQQRWRPEG